MSITSEEVEVLLHIARDATLGSTFLERIDSLTESFSLLVPNTSLTAYVIDPRSPTGPASANLLFKNRDPAHLLEYVQHYMDVDPMRSVFEKGKGEAYLLSEFCPRRSWGRDAFTGEFLPRFGVRHIMAMSRRLPSGQLFALAFHRENGIHDFTAKEREFLRLVAPDFGRAAYGALLTEKLAHVDRGGAPATCGALVFSTDGELLHADPGALSLMDELRDHDAASADAVLEEARRIPRDHSALEGATVQRIFPLSGRRWLTARFSVARRGARRYVLAVLELARPGTPEWFDFITARYGLTDRQRDIARLVMRGLGNRGIARELEISMATVNFHLMRAYQKTGVHGRYELAALLLGIAPQKNRR